MAHPLSSYTTVRTIGLLSLIAVGTFALVGPANAQITATARTGATPAWNKGLQPISPESYYNAIECGNTDAADPPCVFWDTGLCENDDFTLNAYSAYKQVAYEVWATVRQGQPAPEPNFYAARNTRVTISAEPKSGSSNEFQDLILKRGDQVASPVDRNIRAKRVTWDYDAWAPRSAVTLEMVGSARTISCNIPAAALQQFR